MVSRGVTKGDLKIDLIKKDLIDNSIDNSINEEDDNNLTSQGCESDTKERESYKPLSAHKVKLYLSESGPVALSSPGFQVRDSQQRLAVKICNSYNKGEIGVFEAGTGVGKSYAYLIPAILWAAQNGERTVISTGTIALQDQIVNKDLPKLLKVLKNVIPKKDFETLIEGPEVQNSDLPRQEGRSPVFMTVKGRGNYICKRRLKDALEKGKGTFDTEGGVIDIDRWARTSDTGCRSDLPYSVESNIWSEVNSETGNCMQKRCPYYSECFVTKMKAQAERCYILVVNHHIFFADVETRLEADSFDKTCVLPVYRHVLFDEAHAIDDAARSFFSNEFNQQMIDALTLSLFKFEKGENSGYLTKVSKLVSLEKEKSASKDLPTLIGNILEAAQIVEKTGEELLSKKFTLRLCQENAKNFLTLLQNIKILRATISNFLEYASNLMDEVPAIDKDNNDLWSAKATVKKLYDILSLLDDFNQWEEEARFIFFIERVTIRTAAGSVQMISFNRTPLDISLLLTRGVYDHIDSASFLSATLKTGHNFDYYKANMGLNLAKQKVFCEEFSSPFDYGKNMLMAIPLDAPSPKDEGFNTWCEKAIIALIKAARGRTLVLFTSYQMLRSCYRAAKGSGDLGAYRLFFQGEVAPGKLLEAFRDDVSSVLFATSTFWQGVDVPGDSLSQVIIVKLPFMVPDDPIFQAQCEIIEKAGKDSFMDLMLPDAVIKFRQGVGRLIRGESDKGVISILDNRLIKKFYGKSFINAVPSCIYEFSTFSKIISKIEQFLGEE